PSDAVESADRPVPVERHREPPTVLADLAAGVSERVLDVETDEAHIRESAPDRLHRVELAPARVAALREPRDHHERPVEIVTDPDRVAPRDATRLGRVDVGVLVGGAGGRRRGELRQPVPSLEANRLVGDRVHAHEHDHREEDHADRDRVGSRRLSYVYGLLAVAFVHLREGEALRTPATAARAARPAPERATRARRPRPRGTRREMPSSATSNVAGSTSIRPANSSSR